MCLRKEIWRCWAWAAAAKKAKISDSLKDFCQDLPHSGLELVSIQLRTTGSHDTVDIQIMQPEQHKEVSKGTEENVPHIAQLMLQFGISYQFYHELSCIVKELAIARSIAVWAILWKQIPIYVYTI